MHRAAASSGLSMWKMCHQVTQLWAQYTMTPMIQIIKLCQRLNDVTVAAHGNHDRQHMVRRQHPHVPSAWHDNRCERIMSSADIYEAGAIALVVRTALVLDKQVHGDCTHGTAQNRDHDNSTHLHGAFSDNVAACVKQKNERLCGKSGRPSRK